MRYDSAGGKAPLNVRETIQGGCMSANKNPSDSRQKKEYVSPKLIQFGSIDELTGGGTGDFENSGMTATNKRP